jgi:alpha/beta hydrolase family protein
MRAAASLGAPAPRLPYRLWVLARLTSQLLDALGHERVHIMGVSWGGAIAVGGTYGQSEPVRALPTCRSATVEGRPPQHTQFLQTSWLVV